MKHTTFKFFYNYEKEERWINSMSAKGMALVDYFWARYVFEEEDPGKYIYKIEFLDKMGSKNIENIAYVSFLEDLGVECVGIYMHWATFRKEAKEGPFEIFTDLNSRIKSCRKISRWWLSLAAFEGAIGLYESILAAIQLSIGKFSFLSTVIFPSLIMAFAILFFSLGWSIRAKLKELIKESKIYEA